MDLDAVELLESKDADKWLLPIVVSFNLKSGEKVLFTMLYQIDIVNQRQ